MRRSIVSLSVLTGVLFLLACMGLVFPIDFLAAISLGWIWYLRRTLPEVQVATAGAATAATYLVLFVVGSHAFLGWLYREIPRPAGATLDEKPRWKWRWTGSLVFVLVLMFVAGMSITGMTHQLGWLLTSPEPWTAANGGGRDAARRAQSINNLKQIGLALGNYEQANQSLPPGGTFDHQGRPLQSWQAMILPYIEQESLHIRIDFARPYTDPRNAPVFQTMIPAYLNPGIPEYKNSAGYALSHYAANVYMLGGDHPRKMSDVTDGSAFTMMAGEVTTGFKAWGDPTDWRDPGLGLNQNPDGFGGPFPGGVSFLFVDGSVRFVKNAVNPKVLKALSTPAGGEKLLSDQY
jgi:prepilin-type processing-associated H-X9-DG protein